MCKVLCINFLFKNLMHGATCCPKLHAFLGWLGVQKCPKRVASGHIILAIEAESMSDPVAQKLRIDLIRCPKEV